MCVIIWNPKGRELHRNMLETAYLNNPDGFGIMWPENGRVLTAHTMDGLEEIIKLHKHVRGIPHAMHFRFRTRGKTDIDQCHPFQVLDKDKDGMDMWLMHNGTFTDLPSDEVKSDTRLFAERLREKIYASDKNKDFYEILNDFKKTIGYHNKVFIMSSNMDAITVNQSRGTWMGGVWFSNTYSLISPTRGERRKPKKKHQQYLPHLSAFATSTKKKGKKKKRKHNKFESRPNLQKIVKRANSTFKSQMSSGHCRFRDMDRFRRTFITRNNPAGKPVKIITYMPVDEDN